MFTETLKPFYSTGLTVEQRERIAVQISIITEANTKILETIIKMDDGKKAFALLRGADKISNGSQELFMLIS